MGSIVTTLDEEHSILRYLVEGEISYAEIRQGIEDYYTRDSLTKYTLWDFSRAEIGASITSENIRRLAKQVEVHKHKRPGGCDVLVVPNVLAYGLTRMYIAYAGLVASSKNELRAHVVYSAEAGEEWILQDSTRAGL